MDAVQKLVKSARSTRLVYRIVCIPQLAAVASVSSRARLCLKEAHSLGGGWSSSDQQDTDKECTLRFVTRQITLTEQVFQDSLAIGQFLRHETGRGQHGQASILQLLGLHLGKSCGVTGLEAQRIKTKVTGNVVRL
jgi:hypothetical protein